MVVDIDMYDVGDEAHVTLEAGPGREAILKVTSIDEDPNDGYMQHEPVLILKCETVSRGTACQLEKLADGRVRFRYEGSDSPTQVHAAWGKRDPNWDSVPA